MKLSESDEKSSSTYSERDLQGRLTNPNGDSDTGEEDDTDKLSDSEELAQTDFQLFEALNLLKGLHILGGIGKS